jgi:6-pyruvoyltetrahydropterin/6-carboxytetrahydropterin synthase
MMSVTRRLEFDAGHRIPDHRSQCRNLHGHRYVLEVTLQGETAQVPGASDNGMVMDFTDIKDIARRHVVDAWDHAFLVHAEDHAVRGFLESMEGHKTVVLDCVPTVENLARVAFELLKPHYRSHYGGDLRLARVRLYETPNCWADYDGPRTGAT